MVKIAIFTDTYVPDVNGVARTLHRFTTYLQKEGIEFRVFAPKATKDSQFSSKIHEFRSIPFLLYPECRIALPNMLHINEEIQAFQPDVIHVATPFSMGLSGVHYAKKYNIPLLGSYHTDFDKYLEHYHLHFLSDVLWKYLTWFHEPFEKIFVPSTDTMERLEKRHFKNMAIWSRGIDGELFHPNYDSEVIRKKYGIIEKHILLYVGRIASEKDVMMLPEINKALPNKLKNNSHWLVVGDGPMKGELEKQAPDNMTLTGFIEGPELANIYATADVFVFPSASETFGNVVLEAMACGTPVVGANAGGVRTIVEQGKNGLLGEEKDVASFAEAVAYLLENNSIRNKMGEEAFQFGQSQHWDTIFAQLLQDYETVLDVQTLKRLA
jgi:glycosyltransferase involved in cell wall biosynthesis